MFIDIVLRGIKIAAVFIFTILPSSALPPFLHSPLLLYCSSPWSTIQVLQSLLTVIKIRSKHRRGDDQKEEQFEDLFDDGEEEQEDDRSCSQNIEGIGEDEAEKRFHWQINMIARLSELQDYQELNISQEWERNEVVE